jgi:hypothetical protein
MEERSLVFGLFVIVGLFMAAFAVPLIKRLVKPNWFYGFRVPATVHNPDLWYPANEYAGRWLFALGIGTIVLATLVYLIPSVGPDILVLSITLALVPFVILMIVMCYVRLRKLKRERAAR